MRKSVFLIQILLLIAISSALAFTPGKTTIDPNTPGNALANQLDNTDPRLSQKITYQVKLRPIADMVDDLTRLTNITFIAGSNKSDWRVREDCTTIMAKNIPLSSLMNSIAHAMKFRWIRAGKKPNWTYRLVEDKILIAQIKHRTEELKNKDIEKRKQLWDKLQRISKMSDIELTQIKEDEPQIYLCKKAGVLNPFIEFIQQTPAVRDAWIAGEELKLSAAWLSPAVKQTLVKIIKAGIQRDIKIYTTPENIDNSYLSKLAALNIDNQQIIIVIPKSNTSYPFSPICVASPEYNGFFEFDSMDNRFRKLDCKIELRAYEEHRPFKEIRDEMKDQIAAAIKEQKPEVQIKSDDKSDDPTLSEPLKKGVATKTITSLIASLADASGFAIVTDDFRGRAKFTIAKGTKFREVLDNISKSRYYNWNKNAQIIELWDVNWYENRESRVSNTWREQLRRKFKEIGTLDIDDLTQIALLTDNQFHRIMNDDILKHARNIWSQRDYLKIYASLTPNQRWSLSSNWGIAFTDLTTEQQQSIIKLISGKNVSFLENLDLASIGIRITCTKEKQGKRFVYTLKASTSLGEIPGQYKFQTPLYIEPAKPKASKEQKP